MASGNIENAINHAILGDIIGFGNGKTEFNNGTVFSEENFSNFAQVGADYSNELVFNFIYQGGYSQHPKPDMTVSDDSVMLLANCKALTRVLKGESMISSFLSEYSYLVTNTEYGNSNNHFIDRYKGGITTTKSLENIANGLDYLKFPYNSKAGGSGGSMRSAIIGAVYSKTSDLLTLLETTIESTLMTHPNNVAILGSIVVALFASYAIRGDQMNMWPVQMIDVLEGTDVDEILLKRRPDFETYLRRDKLTFINKWKNYYEERFIEGSMEYKKSLAMKYPSERTLFYNKFSSRTRDIYPGAGGDDSSIIAFDCLISSEGSIEHIVTYSMLHVGDSDTTGCICGFLYGLVYGSNPISEIMIKNIKTREYVNGKKVVKDLLKVLR